MREQNYPEVITIRLPEGSKERLTLRATEGEPDASVARRAVLAWLELLESARAAVEP